MRHNRREDALLTTHTFFLQSSWRELLVIPVPQDDVLVSVRSNFQSRRPLVLHLDLPLVRSSWVLPYLLQPLCEYCILVFILSHIIPSVRDKFIDFGNAAFQFELVLEIYGLDVVNFPEHFRPAVYFSIREHFTDLFVKILRSLVELARSIFVFTSSRIDHSSSRTRVAAFDFILRATFRCLPIWRQQLGFLLFFGLLCQRLCRLGSFLWLKL